MLSSDQPWRYLGPVCGIAGVISPATPDRDAALARACAAMAHRGPDGTATHLDAQVALGHTRLSIIDRTAASDQPMIDTDTGSVLVFNGEIYNYRELRAELEGCGHQFRSAGDTEVLLQSYRRWGTDCLTRLNGMFAFALWDPERRGLFLARDRLGEKPLLFTTDDRAWWFASEAKALLAAGALVARPEPEALFRFLAFGDLGHPTQNVFAGVTSLAPAHAAWIEPGGSLRTWRYWSVPDSATEPLSPAAVDERLDEIDATWTDSVRLRLRSDVPVGTSLSGGPDSSAVIATVRQLRGEGDLHAFTASFPDTEADELPLARAVAAKVGATLHPVPLEARDLADDLDTLMWANESPVEATSQLAQYRVMREARDAGVVVLLDGQGADEVFGGYDKYAGAIVADHALRGDLAGAFDDERAWRRVHGGWMVPPIGRYVGAMGGPRRLMGTARVALGGRWLAADWRRQFHHLDPIGGDPHPEAVAGSVAASLMRQDLTRWTLPRLLRYGDRNSMSWSREVRLPFLDHRLIDLATSLPADQRVVDGWTKLPIRHILRRLGLTEVADRRDKKAYMPPQQKWLAEPALATRVADAWSDLHQAGLLAGAVPVESPLHQWRVLSLHTWAHRFELNLSA